MVNGNPVSRNSTAATLYNIFSCIEITMYVVGFVFTMALLIIFYKTRLLHVNLVVVFCSLLISSSIASVIRIYYLLKIITESFVVEPEVVVIARLLRIGAVYAGRLTM
ncbi:unnamed protein product [Nippostrongylus brasiliensis]|uniref:G protein-coupled receptor n=1 Tax=Nippostrongylus brasiliensis TaxID=27835 RepID=A0A0N4YLV3_NIPBR|nr:unnamed protein product [Nippostrongylus brasiliensis]